MRKCSHVDIVAEERVEKLTQLLEYREESGLKKRRKLINVTWVEFGTLEYKRENDHQIVL